MTDKVDRAKGGHKDSFAELIEYSKPTMYRVAKSILKNDEDCADAMQEAIFRSFKSLGSLKNPRYFKTWLIRILINECNNILNNRKNKASLEEENIVIVHNDTYRDIEVWEAVKALDDDLRTMVVLYYFEDMSIKDIGDILKIPQGTVKSRLARARQRLGEILKVGKEVYVHE